MPVSLDEYLRLRSAVGWGSPPREVTASALAATLAWAVERDADGRLLGLARAVGDGMYVVVVDVMVAPGSQSHGLGRRLVETLAADPAVRGARHATLLADPGVAGFYRRLGLPPVDGTTFRLGRDA